MASGDINFGDRSQAEHSCNLQNVGVGESQNGDYQSTCSNSPNVRRRIIVIKGVSAFKPKTRKGQKREKAKPLVVDGGNPIPVVGFSCFCCNMSFKSEKALHGHMRTHPKRTWRGIRPPPNHNHNNRDIMPTTTATTSSSSSSEEWPQFDEREAADGLVLVQYVLPRHQCPKCFRVFKTGQSLGGHMRAHYHDQEAGEEEGETTCANVRDFDLNAIPEMEAEDHE